MRQKCYRFCAMLLMPFMMVINCPMTGLAADAADVPEMNIKITHDPVKEATAGQRIPLEAKVVDEAGVEIVRAYFKAVEAAEFNFVVLTSSENDTYRGTLPAPANGVGAIDYLILVKNANNQVVKTQTYRITVADSDNAAAAVAKNDQITVYTELQEAPTEITGFSDNIAVDIVESGAKLGVVVGLYSTATAGGSTSGAVAGGTVTASTSGVSTTAIVVGAVAGAAGAAAVAASSLSSSGGGNNAGGGTTETCNSVTTNGGDTPETHSIALGKNSGTFVFSYQMYTIKDRMTVSVAGRTLMNTGCVSGTRTVSLSFSGGSTAVVRVFPNCRGTSGTAWKFTVGCP